MFGDQLRWPFGDDQSAALSPFRAEVDDPASHRYGRRAHSSSKTSISTLRLTRSVNLELNLVALTM